MEVASRSVNDEQALFDEDDQDDEIVLGRTDVKEEGPETSKQRLLSRAKVQPIFEGLKITNAGHKIQEIREMQTVPVSVLINFYTNSKTDCVISGHRHRRSHQEPSCHQGLQCQPLRC